LHQGSGVALDCCDPGSIIQIETVTKYMSRKPLVLVPACSKEIGDHAFYAVGKKYVDALVIGANCHALILPLLDNEHDLAQIVLAADGIMLTGSPSNVHPSHYGQTPRDPRLPLDPARDAVTLYLSRTAVAMGLPLFAICRGFQEVNVGFGGSLLQAVHEEAGKMDHREDESQPLDRQYAPAHRVSVLRGGRLATILGGVPEIEVNSLHGQGIDRLGRGLIVDALAEDGLIEAYHVQDAAGFTLAVQWHPEWKVAENAISMQLFRAFGEACTKYASTRNSH
jgi:putative glutamine amidotransferase